MLTLKKIHELEIRLQATDRELDSIIKTYFNNEPLADMGDTANVVDLLHMQADLVERLAHEKLKLLRKHRE